MLPHLIQGYFQMSHKTVPGSRLPGTILLTPALAPWGFLTYTAYSFIHSVFIECLVYGRPFARAGATLIQKLSQAGMALPTSYFMCYMERQKYKNLKMSC